MSSGYRMGPEDFQQVSEAKKDVLKE